MISITLVAGAAVFGFINGQAASSAGSYSNSLNEKFTIAYSFFLQANPCTSPTCTQLKVAVYNNGQVPLGIVSITVTEQGTGKTAVFTTGSGSCVGTVSPALPTQSSPISVQNQPPGVYQLTLPASGAGCLTGFTPGTLYTISSLGLHGYSTQVTVTK